MAGLIKTIDTVTAIAGAHFAGFRIDPVAFTNDCTAVRAREFPNQRTLRRHESRDGPISRDFCDLCAESVVWA